MGTEKAAHEAKCGGGAEQAGTRSSGGGGGGGRTHIVTPNRVLLCRAEYTTGVTLRCLGFQ